MLDPDSSINIVIIVDNSCWKRSASQWQVFFRPAILETLHQSQWKQGAEINILLTDDITMKKLNQKHRGYDKPTNVLSFPSLEPSVIPNYKKQGQAPVILGDIALAFETIQKESLDQNKPFDHHLLHLTIHGVLHLLGFDHQQEEDAFAMESLEIKILSTLMIPNPYQELSNQNDETIKHA